MSKARLEAFSDGAIAIIITIMVLDLKIPWARADGHRNPQPRFHELCVSFVCVGIYWNNHHHLPYTVQDVHGGIHWANLHFLFWLSPFFVHHGWMGQNYFAAMVPTVVYGGVLLMAAILSGFSSG